MRGAVLLSGTVKTVPYKVYSHIFGTALGRIISLALPAFHGESVG